MAHKAHERATNRAVTSRTHKRLKNDDKFRRYARRRIKHGWSPELIAGRLKKLHPELAISHEAIYQWIYADARDIIPFLVRANRNRKREAIHGVTRKPISRRQSRYPKWFRLSITYDNGYENTEHVRTNKILGTRSYFCEPFRSWEKGTVENTIGLVRRFFPKKTYFAKVSKNTINPVERWLNHRPRKRLGFLTPLEVANSFGVALQN